MEQISYGDISEIATVYNERNSKNGKTVSVSYVWLLIHGTRDRKSDTAKEVISIAKSFIKKKRQFRNELIAA